MLHDLYECHAFPIAILTQLLPQFLITKEVCSKSTSIVFPRIPYLVPALAQEFLYVPCGHLETDLSIVRNENLRDILYKGPKFREPVSFSWHQNYNIIMDACEVYARQWNKKEDVGLDIFPNGLSLLVMWLNAESDNLNILSTSDPSPFFVTLVLSMQFPRLHENFVIVPVDKASNNYTFVCKKHYVDILIKELGLHSLPGNPTQHLMLAYYMLESEKWCPK